MAFICVVAFQEGIHKPAPFRVTYKWLSYTLGVHVNQAKQMLYDYVERKRKENSGAQLHVTYLVAGNLMQNGHACHKVAVVREDKLEAMKSKLATIASVHVYSIQKALLKDSYNTDYDIVKTNLHNCSKPRFLMTIFIQFSVRKSKLKQTEKNTSDALSKALT
ncbi:LOW QUALITY PROTEIN: DNA polymerase delta subunit 3-like [Theristicus caerulescens]